MILYIGVTRETVEITDPSDAIAPTFIIKVIRETIYDRLRSSRDTSHVDQIDSESTHPIVSDHSRSPSRFQLGNRHPRKINDYPRTNISL